jgi:TetR/AcrR family tetracycline transcriptional repressor
VTRPREPLSRTRILQTAVTFADEHGLTALTMRRLAEVLGVEAMSLYYHVNGREDLLEGMVAEIVGTLRLPSSDGLGPQDRWQVFLQRAAHDIRGIATMHPNLFPLIATRPPAAPWLRPPLRSLQLVEEFLSGLVGRGLPDDAAVHVYKVFTGFLLGQLLLEVAQRGAETGPAEEPLDEGGAEVAPRRREPDLADCPTVLRMQERLTHHEARVEFEQALESLLDRLDRELSQ